MIFYTLYVALYVCHQNILFRNMFFCIFLTQSDMFSISTCVNKTHSTSLFSLTIRIFCQDSQNVLQENGIFWGNGMK